MLAVEASVSVSLSTSGSQSWVSEKLRMLTRHVPWRRHGQTEWYLLCHPLSQTMH
jgi:hypothetical protein